MFMSTRVNENGNGRRQTSGGFLWEHNRVCFHLCLHLFLLLIPPVQLKRGLSPGRRRRRREEAACNIKEREEEVEKREEVKSQSP